MKMDPDPLASVAGYHALEQLSCSKACAFQFLDTTRPQLNEWFDRILKTAHEKLSVEQAAGAR